MFEPLLITAYPRCAIECDAYLPIDGILFASAMAQSYGPESLTTPGKQSELAPVDLPIEKRTINGEWFYATSFAQWGPCADGQTFWTKRFDRKTDHLVDFGKSRGKVITEQGRYKAYMMPVFYRCALSVSWYVYGDGDAIMRLLSTVTHIGKKTSQGNGRINKWTVEFIDADYSVFGPDGQVMRSVPEENGVLYGVRPSYWASSNQVPCRLPNV